MRNKYKCCVTNHEVGKILKTIKLKQIYGSLVLWHSGLWENKVKINLFSIVNKHSELMFFDTVKSKV